LRWKWPLPTSSTVRTASQMLQWKMSVLWSKSADLDSGHCDILIIDYFIVYAPSLQSLSISCI
jgi:hypothetical protein